MATAAKEYKLTDAGWTIATEETSRWRCPEPGALELELVPLLRAHGTRYVIERTLMSVSYTHLNDLLTGTRQRFTIDVRALVNIQTDRSRLGVEKSSDRGREPTSHRSPGTLCRDSRAVVLIP